MYLQYPKVTCNYPQLPYAVNTKTGIGQKGQINQSINNRLIIIKADNRRNCDNKRIDS